MNGRRQRKRSDGRRITCKDHAPRGNVLIVSQYDTIDLPVSSQCQSRDGSTGADAALRKRGRELGGDGSHAGRGYCGATLSQHLERIEQNRRGGLERPIEENSTIERSKEASDRVRTEPASDQKLPRGQAIESGGEAVVERQSGREVAQLQHPEFVEQRQR